MLGLPWQAGKDSSGLEFLLLEDGQYFLHDRSIHVQFSTLI